MVNDFLCIINKVKYVNLTHLDKSSYFGDSYGSYDQWDQALLGWGDLGVCPKEIPWQLYKDFVPQPSMADMEDETGRKSF